MLKLLSHELHQILSEAALFACTDTTLPTINAVMLEYDGTNLAAIATDRFKLGVSHIQPAKLDDDERKKAKVKPFQIALRLDDVHALIKHAKTPQSEKAKRVVSLDAASDSKRIKVTDSLSPNIFSFTSYSGADVSLTVHAVNGEFPNWRKLVGGREYAPLPAVTLDPQHMAAFFKVAALHGYPRVSFAHTGPNSPVIVHMNPSGPIDFVGLVMPIRSDSDGGNQAPTQPDWLKAMLKATK